MKNLLALILLVMLPACALTGEPDWPRVADTISVVAMDLRSISELSSVEETREELLEIAAALELVAPLIAEQGGSWEAAEALEVAHALCGTLLGRDDLQQGIRDAIVIAQIAINHARVLFPVAIPDETG